MNELRTRPRRAPRGLLPALLLAPLLAIGCRSGAGGEPDRRPSLRGAVVCEHPLATAVGLGVLEQGGNAADAAIATALALAVVFPEAGNLGGGGFALWVPAAGEALALDFRETAPAAARPEHYLDGEGRVVPARSLEGPLAVGVPGSPLGLWRLYEAAASRRFSFQALAAPAIRLAREGFAVDPWLARALREEGLERRMNGPARALFYPGGRPLAEGELLVQPDLARTLERLAERSGAEGFYRGDVASAIVRTLTAAEVPGAEGSLEGRMTLEDLRRYDTVPRRPLRGWFRGYELFVMPPPSSGGIVVLQALAVLEGLPLDAEVESAGGTGQEPTARLLHWWAEALRRAFADRAEHMGDPDFHAVPTEALLAPRWIAARRVSIGERADLGVAPYAPDPPAEGRHTTHLSTLDAQGNAVSLTTTLNDGFGSGLLVEGAGFLLNNELDDFAIQAGAPNLYGLVGGRANALEPLKRPLSSMTPTVVRDSRGRVVLVLGSPGGPRIISAVFQTLLRVLLLEQPLERAVAAPRLHQQWRPATTRLEPGLSGQVAEDLRERGHDVLLVEDGRFGSVQAISIGPGGEVRAFSDPRRGGAAGLVGAGVAEPALPR